MANIYSAIGLMSGTSLDAVDAVFLRTDGLDFIERVASFSVAFDEEFRGELMAIATGVAPLTHVLQVERLFTKHALKATLGVLNLPKTKQLSKPDVIGFHGQTVRHLPDENLTFQMGDSSYLSEKSGIPVVSDFRRRDMAAGGEGAPLASYYHSAILKDYPGCHMVLNLGGVANITAINSQQNMPNKIDIVAGDVGPGNGQLDLWMQKYFGQPYDDGGKISLMGQVDRAWITQALQKNAFFQKSLPKSADRYQFEACWPDHLSPKDGAATLAALTATAVVEATSGVFAREPNVWLAGGGAKNQAIVQELKKKFSKVSPIDDIGISAQMLEAECFAWLAVRRLKGLPTSGPQTTGATKETSGGVLTASCIYQ